MRDWCVYLLRCADDTLYCGITNDLTKRVADHNAGRGAKYTRGRLPVAAVATRCDLTECEARSLEYHVKRLPRSRKIQFLQG